MNELKKITNLVKEELVKFQINYEIDARFSNFNKNTDVQINDLIKIKKDGTASSNYGSGEIGEWKLTDGNLTIFWNSGKTDYFFSGVMGYQRIRKNKNQSYTSGLRKSSN